MTEKSVKQILIEARKLIEKEGHWCKQNYALADNGESVSELSREAVCFCAQGALNRAAGEILCAADEPCVALTIAAGARGVVAWNDRRDRTHSEVLAAFDRAIEAAP